MRYEADSTKKEIEDLGIAVLALTFAFTVSSYVGYRYHPPPGIAITILVYSFIAVIVAMLFHELAHRQVARKYGGYARFKLWPIGVLISVIISMLGFVIAVTGAVNIGGIYDRERMGKIALAGPASNLVFGIVFFILAIVTPAYFQFSALFVFLSRINFYIGTFNMIPFGPLDGGKVLAWNMRNFAVVFIISLFGTILSFVYL